jgi:CubicO group peptidase (beta-lactamase class C family)
MCHLSRKRKKESDQDGLCAAPDTRPNDGRQRMSQQQPNRLTRSEFLKTATGTVAAATATSLVGFPAPAGAETSSPAASGDGSVSAAGSLFDELDARIRAGMKKHGIPGVALGMIYRGSRYVKGYGITNVDYPLPVDGDTLFRIGSTTKTFTGTVVMRLVEKGKIDLDARVREYLPDFATSQPSVARRVTVRQLLNHSAGWLGEDYQDAGRGDNALARYVRGMERLPQLTPPGEVFAYNNAALVLAGRVIEAVTGSTYEEVVRKLLLDPLGMKHSRFFSDEIIGFNVAASHAIVDGKPAVDPSMWYAPRTLHPTGGLISSVRDQLRYARFHLGNGTTPNGTRLLTRKSLVSMRSNPGPGGTLFVELDGMGVTWQLRPSAQGVRIVQHGGDYLGQHAGFIMVPERGFALTVLTNSDGGPQLLGDLFVDDWALKRFAGVSNLPARPRALSKRELAPYEGLYTGQIIDPILTPSGSVAETRIELKGTPDGRLRMRRTDSVDSPGIDSPLDFARAENEPVAESSLAFYRNDYVLALDENGEPFVRANFVRGPNGGIKWLRFGGRLYRHQ